MFFNITSTISTKSIDGIFLSALPSQRPALWRIVGYTPITAVTNMALDGILPRF